MFSPENETGEVIEAESKQLENTRIVSKLGKRLEHGKPADIVCLDIDGTVYEKMKNQDGQWVKEGDNTVTSQKLTEGSIPLVLISARPDWDDNSDREMEGLNLCNADAVIAGAGTLIYWRDQDGKMKIDEEYLQKLREQKITYEKDGEKFEEPYNPESIREVLDNNLQDLKDSGLVTKVKVDTNKGIGFTTIDISDMPFKQLHELRSRIMGIKGLLKGVRVTFSEDLEQLSGETFSGWVQILPENSNKGLAMTYLLEKTARTVNPASIDQKKPRAHAVGDSAVDMWMLLASSREDDPYEIKGHLLKNASTYATKRMEGYIEAYTDDPVVKQEVGELIDADGYEARRSQLMDELKDLGNDSAHEKRRIEINKYLRQMRVIENSQRTGQKARIANVKPTEGRGANGVLEVVESL